MGVLSRPLPRRVGYLVVGFAYGLMLTGFVAVFVAVGARGAGASPTKYLAPVGGPSTTTTTSAPAPYTVGDCFQGGMFAALGQAGASVPPQFVAIYDDVIAYEAENVPATDCLVGFGFGFTAGTMNTTATAQASRDGDLLAAVQSIGTVGGGSDEDVDVQACFLAGQASDDPPDANSVSCATAWTSGQATQAHLDGEADRDVAYRGPFLLASGVAVFCLVLLAVRSFRGR